MSRQYQLYKMDGRRSVHDIGIRSYKRNLLGQDCWFESLALRSMTSTDVGLEFFAFGVNSSAAVEHTRPVVKHKLVNSKTKRNISSFVLEI